MAKLSKICLHWTAGSNNPCAVDLAAYHYLIDSQGRIFEGKHKPEDNLDCTDGNYAAHCGGGNTGCIGLSACGMAGFTTDKKQTKYPLTQIQIERMCAMAAHLTIKYKINIDENTVFTHHEFDQKKHLCGGKIDIVYLPYLPNLQVNRIGGYLRNKVVWYRKQILDGKCKLVKKGNYYEFYNPI